MFLAIKEIKHAKVHYGLIIAMDLDWVFDFYAARPHVRLGK